MGRRTLLAMVALVTLIENITGDLAPFPVTPTQEYRHRAMLDEDARYFFFWQVDDDSITLEVHAKTLGWVGWGLSHNGAMKGADIIIGWVKDGQPFFADRHGIGNQLPEVDESQDYELLDAAENGEFTMLKFKRRMETCDEHDVMIDQGTARVLFSWSEEDPVSESAILQHQVRGGKSLLLLDTGKPLDVRHEESDLEFFDLIVNDGHVGSDRTTYWCRTQALPKFDNKVHVVRVDPLIEKATAGVVHHIIGYACHGSLQTEEQGKVCWEGNMPENATACDTILFGWAVGQGPFHFPDEAGLPLGYEGAPQFVHIEMHYDNPEGHEGIIDNSGLRIYYTPELRKYDSGVLLLGHALWWPKMVVPPNAEKFRIDAYCSQECTEAIGEDGINVFATLLHTHLVGTAVHTRVIRNGTEQPMLSRDDHYDFNFQEVRQLAEPYKIKPGDELITSCFYNTKKETKVTLGGAGTDNEMCFNFLFYYPRMSMQSCLSLSQPYFATNQWIMQKAMAGEIDVDPVNEDDIYELMDKISWTEEDVAILQSHMDLNHGFRQTCTHAKSGFGTFGGGTSTYHEKITIKEPFIKESRCNPLPEDGTDFTSSAPAVWRETSAFLIGLLALAGAVFC